MGIRDGRGDIELRINRFQIVSACALFEIWQCGLEIGSGDRVLVRGLISSRSRRFVASLRRGLIEDVVL